MKLTTHPLLLFLSDSFAKFDWQNLSALKEKLSLNDVVPAISFNDRALFYFRNQYFKKTRFLSTISLI